MPRANYIRKRDGGGKTLFSVWLDRRYEKPLLNLSQQSGKSVNTLLVEFCERGGLRKLLPKHA
ncbi:MAG TPA: hypothetical protein VFU31_21120 [Candidatus Binatia bacterium]|nr:hypothetical protein [Candidatus Binatia bacterium]